VTFDRSVPCNGCTACCRDQLVVLVEEDGDPAQYRTVPLEGAGDESLRQLETKPDGACIYLGEQGCEIYDRRPAMCRTFDCRLMVREFLRGNLRWPNAMAHPIMKAGIERLPSLPVD